MTTMRRIYLPLTTEQLLALRDGRELTDERFDAFAVTDAARAGRPGVDDDEVHEYAASQDAALAAIALGAQVVAAADVAEGSVTDGSADAKVVTCGPLPLKRFASFHLIDGDAAAEHPDQDIELSWFDATELGLLLDVIDSQ